MSGTILTRPCRIYPPQFAASFGESLYFILALVSRVYLEWFDAMGYNMVGCGGHTGLTANLNRVAFIAGMILPYNDPNLLTKGAKNVSVSPFTLVFKKGGLDVLAHVINGVILCTILSCANSGLYVSTRTLYALANEGLTPKKLGKQQRLYVWGGSRCACLRAVIDLLN